MRLHPVGLIKEMLKVFGNDFQSLLDMEGVHSVKYLVNIRQLEIIASEEGFNKVKIEIVKVSQGLTPHDDDEGDLCPVCFSAPDHDQVRLEVCGHLYCAECFIMTISSSSWPLICAAEDCDQHLAVEDFKKLDTDTFNKLQKNAMDHNFGNPDSTLKPCPSPNCTGVFRRFSDKNSNENEGFFCTSCGVIICRR